MKFCPQCGQQQPANSRFCVKCGHQLDSAAATRQGPPPLPNSPPPPAPARPATPVYGDFLRRVAAYIVDYVIALLIFAVLGVIATQILGRDDSGNRTLLLFLLCIWLYKAGFEGSSLQATPAKMLFSIKVTGMSGERIGFGRASGRFFAQILSQFSLTIGYVVAAFTEKRQALHDFLASTLVVRKDATPDEVINSPPGASGGATGVVVAVIVCFAAISVIGILAAIAIPAYQNYTIRAQVFHGVQMAERYKAVVQQSLAKGTDPATINSDAESVSAAGLPDSGPYEESVRVVKGNILITFGRTANPHLQNKRLLLYYLSTPQGGMYWVCGKALPPAGAPVSDGQLSAVTDVPDQYLSAACHR